MRYLFCLVLSLAMLNSFDAKAFDKTLLYDIISKENTTRFTDLLSSDFEVDEQDLDGNTPLMIASSLGKVNFVEFLIDFGADPKKRNYEGSTALHRAAFAGHNDVIEVLINNGALVNMPDLDGVTPLMKAVEGEKRFTVELLVNRGALIQFKNIHGLSAMDIARKKRRGDIFTFLEKEIKAPKKSSEPSYSWDIE
ncbi:MAG: ankyrin repeat domain-containing protein [Alphaproteobacteria bacterium]|nr:ankyrin repeat domain-containing protein [Alphaproteobacteria bacterium]